MIENVKKCCELAGYNQRKVAEVCGVTPQTVSSWFTGKTKMPLECALALRSELGVTLDEMCGKVLPGTDSQELLGIFGLLNDEGKKYLLKQAHFAMREYR